MKMNPKIRINTVSIFPDFFDVFKKYGVISRAIKNRLVDFQSYNLRDFTNDKHKITDKPAYGGDAGMVMLAEPFYNCYQSIKLNSEYKPYVVMTTPSGKIFNNEISINLSNKKNLIIFCGRYEGIDNRVKNIVDEEISIGDYILTGGELPALVIIDSLLRFVSGVIGDKNSVINDSFNNGLLDCPHYTKPFNFQGQEVPEVLLSGNHKKIETFRKKQSILNTIQNRPDLFIKKNFDEEEKTLLIQIITELLNNEK